MGISASKADIQDLLAKGATLGPSVKLPCEEPARSEDQAARSKYGNEWTEVDGQRFQSKKEARVWLELRLEEKAGAIRNLQRQRKYEFVVNGVKVGSFTADFTFVRDGSLIVADVKSEITRRIRDYPLRKKLMKACFGIEIIEL